MVINYEIRNEKLNELVENKAQELEISVDRLIWNYINRGLMEDGLSEDAFRKNHSEEFLKEVSDALDLD